MHTGALRGAKAHCMLYITFQVLVGTYTYIKTQVAIKTHYKVHSTVHTLMKGWPSRPKQRKNGSGEKAEIH